jgi:glycosyltransferase involved in cell wall biosynthesis
VKLAIVVQRYGADISGGAELHARYIAEHLSRYVSVRVFATCARDYIAWRNELPAGPDVVNGIPVERFPVARERDAWEFGRHCERVYDAWHSTHNELQWLDSQGPRAPALVARLRAARHEVDYVLFFCARYWQTYHGVRAVPDKAVLVPTAERDPALGLGIFGPIFRGVRAIVYNSFEERAVIQAVSSNHEVPGAVVGVGSEVPAGAEPARVRAKYGLHGPFVLYVGRIDANKGCGALFDMFGRYAAAAAEPVTLALIGTPVLEIPSHPRIRHLGFVDDRDKFDAIAAAEAIVVPSQYESLSMAALEAWALGRPVLANAACDVLVGQCLRSNAGLYYASAREFAAALDRLLADRSLAATLGRNGRAYFDRHYAWPVVERKYLDLLAGLDARPPRRDLEPVPGWWRRHRAIIPPAAEIVRRLPAGPAAGEAPQAALAGDVA